MIPFAFRMMLLAGIGMFMGGIAIAIYRAFGVVARERLVAVAALAVVLFVGAGLDAVWLIVLLVVLSVIGLLFEHLRIESTRRAETDTSQSSA